jgi:hypothetical protein
VAEPVVDLQPLAEPTTGVASHSIVIEDPPTSTLWPTGNLQCDVRFADASVPPVVVPSDTFVVVVSERVTGV